MSQTFPFFTKKMLTKMNAVAVKRGYNRTFDKDFFSTMPNMPIFPVIYHMVHSHKKGISCDPHIRAVIAFNFDGDAVMECLDCDWKMFHDLPTVTL